MDLAHLSDFDAHEDVRTFDLGQGAHAVIAVHSTHRGPAVGGCRVWRYPSMEAAAVDALRLSRGMSLKNALADLPFGGGKAVISLPAEAFDRVRLFEAFGDAVQSFKGCYITAEDVGSSMADMAVIARRTAFVGGAPSSAPQGRRDPSPWTAYGVFEAIKSAVRWRHGGDLRGRHVAIQGAGAVGAHLAGRLVAAGARVSIADVQAGVVSSVAQATRAEVVSPDEIHRLEADVFAPCALGACLNDRTVSELAATIVCGGANNQLAAPGVEAMLIAAGVTYCPDYLVNAGGIVAVHADALGRTESEVEREVRAVGDRLHAVLMESKRSGLAPGAVADRLAYARIGRAPTLVAESADAAV
jgi:leucine dehydrogenase